MNNSIEFYDIFLSSLRWLIGLSIGSILGLIMGIMTNLLKPNTTILNLNILDFLRAIPIIGLVPVIQMNFGINEFGKIGLITWAVAFPVWVSVKTSFSKDLTNALLILKGAGLTKRDLLLYFHIPRALRGFLKGIDIGIGVGWLSVVAAEWIGTYNTGFWSGGLGYKLDYGYTINNWGMVHLSLLIFGFLGFISSFFYRYVIKIIVEKKQIINIEF